jgi:4-hydroxy-tetrahydrodipicolinate reductase
MPIEVVVHGALGRMGKEVLDALCKDPQLKPVGAVDLKAEGESLPLSGQADSVPLSSNLESLLAHTHPQVLVDFSVAEAAMPAVRLAAKERVNLVVGTTGLSADALSEIDRLARDNEVGAIVAPNFALGAVIMVHLAKIASRYFDYAEIIDLHHEQKLDAPSGTALSTAGAIAEARGKPFLYSKTQKESLRGTRGGELQGVSLHSVRLPGLMAHQMPGVVLAIKKVVGLKGLTYGLDRLLGL